MDYRVKIEDTGIHHKVIGNTGEGVIMNGTREGGANAN